jgi:hypothetical protein
LGSMERELRLVWLVLQPVPLDRNEEKGCLLKL